VGPLHLCCYIQRHRLLHTTRRPSHYATFPFPPRFPHTLLPETLPLALNSAHSQPLGTDPSADFPSRDLPHTATTAPPYHTPFPLPPTHCQFLALHDYPSGHSQLTCPVQLGHHVDAGSSYGLHATGTYLPATPATGQTAFPHTLHTPHTLVYHLHTLPLPTGSLVALNLGQTDLGLWGLQRQTDQTYPSFAHQHPRTPIPALHLPHTCTTPPPLQCPVPTPAPLFTLPTPPAARIPRLRFPPTPPHPPLPTFTTCPSRAGSCSSPTTSAIPTRL